MSRKNQNLQHIWQERGTLQCKAHCALHFSKHASGKTDPSSFLSSDCRLPSLFLQKTSGPALCILLSPVVTQIFLLIVRHIERNCLQVQRKITHLLKKQLKIWKGQSTEFVRTWQRVIKMSDAFLDWANLLSQALRYSPSMTTDCALWQMGKCHSFVACFSHNSSKFLHSVNLKWCC